MDYLEIFKGKDVEGVFRGEAGIYTPIALATKESMGIVLDGEDSMLYRGFYGMRPVIATYRLARLLESLGRIDEDSLNLAFDTLLDSFINREGNPLPNRRFFEERVGIMRFNQIMNSVPDNLEEIVLTLIEREIPFVIDEVREELVNGRAKPTLSLVESLTDLEYSLGFEPGEKSDFVTFYRASQSLHRDFGFSRLVNGVLAGFLNNVEGKVISYRDLAQEYSGNYFFGEYKGDENVLLGLYARAYKNSEDSGGERKDLVIFMEYIGDEDISREDLLRFEAYGGAVYPSFSENGILQVRGGVSDIRVDKAVKEVGFKLRELLFRNDYLILENNSLN